MWFLVTVALESSKKNQFSKISDPIYICPLNHPRFIIYFVPYYHILHYVCMYDLMELCKLPLAYIVYMYFIATNYFSWFGFVKELSLYNKGKEVI